MGKKLIVKNTVLLYIRQIFVLAIGLYASRLTLQVLGASDFGIYTTVGGMTALLTIITTSMSASTQRFMTYELGRGDMVRLNEVYTTSVQIHFLLSIIFVFVAELLGNLFIYNYMTLPAERLNVTFWVFQFAIANCVFNIVNIPNNAAIVAHEDMGVFSLFSIIDAILKISAVIMLYFISWDRLLIYALSLSIIQLINRMICIVWCRKKYIECKYHHQFKKKILRQMIGLAGWSGLISFAVTGFSQGTNILLNVFFGPVMNAAYAIATQVYSGIRSFCSNFQLASNPQIVKLYSQGEKTEMVKLVTLICKISFFLIFVLSLPFIMTANFVLDLWLVEVPSHAVSFFCLLLLYAYVDVWVYPLNISAQATAQMKRYSIIVSSIITLPVPISYVLYLFGAVPEIIFVVAIIISIIGVIAQVATLRSLIGISVKSFSVDVILRCIVTGIVAMIIPLILSMSLPHAAITEIGIFVISFVMAVLSIYIVGLSKVERAIIYKMIGKILHKHG